MKKVVITATVLVIALTGCSDINHMSTGEKALMGVAAAAAVGGIAYGIHNKHKADKNDARASKVENHQHRHRQEYGNACQEWNGHLECAPNQN